MFRSPSPNHMIPPEPTADIQIWDFEVRGLYSVRSGCRVFKQQERAIEGESSGRSVRDPLWKNIWSLRLPKKIKFFACRARRDSLPTQHKLHYQKILEDVLCPFCAIHTGELLHAIYGWPHLLSTWDMHLQKLDPK